MNWSSSWTSGHHLESLWLCDCTPWTEPVKAPACCSAGPNWQGHVFFNLSQPFPTSVTVFASPVPPLTTSHILFPFFILPTSTCICSCKWHCKQNCKAHYIYILHANTHWNKLMIWFKVSVLWSTINTGTSPETLIRYPAIALSQRDLVATHLRAASTRTPGSVPGEGGCLLVPGCPASLDAK